MIDVIEDAILAAIRNATGMDYLKTIATYGGELDDDLNNVVRSFPAIWVVFGGSGKPVKLGVEKWKTPATFVTMVATRNIRNEDAARKGGAVEIGTYEMIKHVKTLMLGQDFGLPIERFEPGAVRTLYNTKIRASGLSVFSLEWTTAYIDRLPTKEEGELLKVGLNYFIKPGDDVVDATDLVTLGA